MTCPLCGDRMAHDAYGAHLRTDHPELSKPLPERHFLTVKPCDHTSPYCDGDECPGWSEDDTLVECESDPDSNCQWRCDPCGDAMGEWVYNGKGICDENHQMTKCPCLIVDWFNADSVDLYGMEPRIGRHEVTAIWAGGYTLHYVDEATDEA